MRRVLRFLAIITGVRAWRRAAVVERRRAARYERQRAELYAAYANAPTYTEARRLITAIALLELGGPR